jgi:twinkle protein
VKARITIAEVSDKLAGRAEAVCLLLLPLGKRHGKIFECGSVYGEPGKTLKVQLDGPHTGKWQDWNGGDKGDLLDLWAMAKSIPVPEALRQAKEFLGIREPTLPERQWAKPEDDKPKLSADGKAMHWLATKRKLEPAIVNRYRVQGDAASKAIVFPCYSPKGALVNRSYRTIDAEKKKVWQDKDAAPCLFGWQALEKAFERREILICEGQIDAMTWAQWGIEALSIPNGTGKTWLEAEWSNLEAFKTIWLAFDCDQAGQANAAEVAGRLGKHRVRIVRMPHKDANAALQAGANVDDAREWVDAAEFATVSHLVNAAHYEAATIEQFFPSALLSGHPLGHTRHDNDELTFRFRPGELTVWTGVSSHGKSTMLNFAMLELASKTQRPSLIVSLEMKPEKVLRRVMLAFGCVVKNAQDVKNGIDFLKNWLLFCDRVGQIDRDELFEILAYANARYGVAHACIDSLMRIKGLEENYPAQNQFIVDLATFSRDSGMHIHLVCHPRKQQGHNAPEAHDIKGSGHIRDNADNVAVVWRNREKEKLLESKLMDDRVKAEQMPDAKLIIEKDREEGMYREFPLSFDPFFFKYSKWAPPAK